MALKDWKKKMGNLSSEKKDIYYINKHTHKYLRILNTSPIIYQLWDDYAEKIEIEKQFKTKQQALKYARSYMRKH